MGNKRHKRQARKSQLSDGELAFFVDDMDGAMRSLPRAEWWFLECVEPRTFALWEAHREEILDYWIARHPGTRPRTWWRFDAPYVFTPDAPNQWCVHRDRAGTPQAAYLREHGLLTQGELRQLFDEDYRRSEPIPEYLVIHCPRLN